MEEATAKLLLRDGKNIRDKGAEDNSRKAKFIYSFYDDSTLFEEDFVDHRDESEDGNSEKEEKEEKNEEEKNHVVGAAQAIVDDFHRCVDLELDEEDGVSSSNDNGIDTKGEENSKNTELEFTKCQSIGPDNENENEVAQEMQSENDEDMGYMLDHVFMSHAIEFIALASQEEEGEQAEKLYSRLVNTKSSPSVTYHDILTYVLNHQTQLIEFNTTNLQHYMQRSSLLTGYSGLEENAEETYAEQESQSFLKRLQEAYGVLMKADMTSIVEEPRSIINKAHFAERIEKMKDMMVVSHGFSNNGRFDCTKTSNNLTQTKNDDIASIWNENNDRWDHSDENYDGTTNSLMYHICVDHARKQVVLSFGYKKSYRTSSLLVSTATTETQDNNDDDDDDHSNYNDEESYGSYCIKSSFEQEQVCVITSDLEKLPKENDFNQRINEENRHSPTTISIGTECALEATATTTDDKDDALAVVDTAQSVIEHALVCSPTNDKVMKAAFKISEKSLDNAAEFLFQNIDGLDTAIETLNVVTRTKEDAAQFFEKCIHDQTKKATLCTAEKLNNPSIDHAADYVLSLIVPANIKEDQIKEVEDKVINSPLWNDIDLVLTPSFYVPKNEYNVATNDVETESEKELMLSDTPPYDTATDISMEHNLIKMKKALEETGVENNITANTLTLSNSSTNSLMDQLLDQLTDRLTSNNNVYQDDTTVEERPIETVTEDKAYTRTKDRLIPSQKVIDQECHDCQSLAQEEEEDDEQEKEEVLNDSSSTLIFSPSNDKQIELVQFDLPLLSTLQPVENSSRSSFSSASSSDDDDVNERSSVDSSSSSSSSSDSSSTSSSSTSSSSSASSFSPKIPTSISSSLMTQSEYDTIIRKLVELFDSLTNSDQYHLFVAGCGTESSITATWFSTSLASLMQCEQNKIKDMASSIPFPIPIKCITFVNDGDSHYLERGESPTHVIEPSNHSLIRKMEHLGLLEHTTVNLH